MRLARAVYVAIFAVALSAPGLCQSPRKMAPLPGDPLELATGPTLVVDTPAKRQAIVRLLHQAHQNTALHTPNGAPFTMKVSFTSSGQTRYLGSGETEETWASVKSWGWTAHLGDYSQLRIFYNGAAYDQNPSTIPLRLHMLRNAVFAPLPMRPPQGLIRVASASWDGRDLMCILTSGAQSDPTPTPGRRWVETEYCVDPKSGLLQIFSEAPGIYVVYDYSDALDFHGHTLARQIVVIEGGSPVLQIHLDSIADGADPASLVPTAQMMAQGPAAMITGPMRFPQPGGVAPALSAGTIQPVIVHAIIDENGKVLDAEALQTSNAALSNAALQLVLRSQYPRQAPGTLPRQREAFVNVKFVSAE